LFCNDSMRIAPPLVISEDQIIYSCEIILKAINETG
jgi:putrescine aminotransferase